MLGERFEDDLIPRTELSETHRPVQVDATKDALIGNEGEREDRPLNEVAQIEPPPRLLAVLAATLESRGQDGPTFSDALLGELARHHILGMLDRVLTEAVKRDGDVLTILDPEHEATVGAAELEDVRQ